MTGMDHDRAREAAGLYALGALPADERALFEAHVSACDECRRDVRAFRDVVNVLPFALPQIDPPQALRSRVLAAAGADVGRSVVVPLAPVRPGRPFVWAAWLSAAAMLVVAIGLGAYTVRLRHRMSGLEVVLREAVARLDRSERQLAAATRDAERAQLRLAVLTAPDMRQVDLAGQPPAPRAAGRAFLSASNGLLFAASQLPPLPAGRTYQVWFLTPGAPISAGLVKPDQSGRVTAAFDVPPGAASPKGLAVSIEPDGGVPAPTGAIYLAGVSN
jgi:anti-sigma-K factor RskA